MEKHVSTAKDFQCVFMYKRDSFDMSHDRKHEIFE